MLNNEISKDNKISGDLLYPHETDNIENTNIKYKRRLERLYNNITNKTSNLYIIITRFNIMDELIFDYSYFRPQIKEQINNFILNNKN